MDINQYISKDDVSTIGLFGTVFAILGVIFILMRNTQKTITPNNYVVNSYLYILLAVLICSLMIMIMDKYNLLNNISSMMLFSVSILTVLVLSAMFVIDIRQVVLRHILWVIFLIGITVILFPIYSLAKHTNILWKSVITVIILILLLTYLTSRLPRTYFQNWATFLSIGLLGFIIFQLFDLIFSDLSGIYSRQKIYGIIGIILFSAFILYDTNKIYRNADIAQIQCKGITNQLQCTDYPAESVNLFLSIINLFSSTVRTQI